MDTTAVAYAAGLYEGEGNIHARSSTGAISLLIRMTDREPLDKVQEAVGIGQVKGPYKSSGPIKDKDYKPLYQWSLYGMEKSQAFVVTNAVKIEGSAELSELPQSMESAKTFDVLAYLYENLSAEEAAVVRELLSVAEPMREAA